ncbi:tRNA lysidine(34) synthetase TilS [Pinirhizobacter soli]|uniref:tRNA lysidine(34) synthetase TilS n=1 Tax=Pinirhizobacter soli TaxID=2786953 RepID=UPI00202A75DE
MNLATALAALPADAPLCIAFSGGGDSMALLHAVAALRPAKLRALHVNHGLQQPSDDWARRCASFCDGLGVHLTVARVEVDVAGGQGPEAAARDARYAAFAAQLGEDEVLLLAHHRGDQVETVLLKLLRGAGPAGLGGMPSSRPLGPGRLLRPLLNVPQAELRQYLDRHGLTPLEDPSNTDHAMARSYLRAEIVPRLARHWPQAAESIVHAANASLAAANFIEGNWRQAWQALDRGGALDATGWLALHEALRVPLLEAWLHGRGLRAPTTAQRRQLEAQIAHAAADRLPCVGWRDTEVHVWRGALHAVRRHPPLPAHWEAPWSGGALSVPGGATLQAEAGSSLPGLTVRLRRGGERIRPAGEAHTRELRDLFQRDAVPPWRRQRLPLLFVGPELVAVPGLWWSDQALPWIQSVHVTHVND